MLIKISKDKLHRARTTLNCYVRLNLLTKWPSSYSNTAIVKSKGSNRNAIVRIFELLILLELYSRSRASLLKLEIQLETKASESLSKKSQHLNTPDNYTDK